MFNMSDVGQVLASVFFVVFIDRSMKLWVQVNCILSNLTKMLESLVGMMNRTPKHGCFLLYKNYNVEL